MSIVSGVEVAGNGEVSVVPTELRHTGRIKEDQAFEKKSANLKTGKTAYPGAERAGAQGQDKLPL